MTWSTFLCRGISALIVVLTLGAAIQAAEPKPDDDKLAGVWLFDAAHQGDGSRLAQVWTSKLTIAGDSFALAKFMDLPKDLKGKFVLDPSANPKTIDLKLDEYDLSEAGAPMKIPACTLPGIYKLDGDKLTVVFPLEIDAKRPTSFDDAGKMVARLTLVKAPAGFQDFPKEVTVKVSGSDGKPAAGVTVAGFMSWHEDPKAKGVKPEWKMYESTKTGDDGTVKLKYEKLQSYAVIARDADNKQVAVASVTPVLLLKGEVSVTLEPECRLNGTIVCDELKKIGKPMSWTNVYLMRNGQRVADCSSSEGLFEFFVPSGTYTLHAYGSDLKAKYVPVTVPADRSEHTVDPINLIASRLILLQGQTAPELEGVVGWKGDKVKLSDLKGKVVLLEYWGYWCGPCVGAMPILIELHEKFADKGLVIIGVHVDSDGEVTTAGQLDEKIAGFRKQLWKGKDIPFPVALTSGKRVGEGEEKAIGGAAGQYGIISYPTTVLIDREGKVVGKFQARDAKSAVAELEKLLSEKK